MVKKQLKNDVVIIGGIHHNTLGVVRSLGEYGVSKNNIYIFLVGKDISKHNIVSKSRYASSHCIFYLENDADITDALLNLAQDKKQRVIICCSDGAASQSYLGSLRGV